VPYAYTSPSPHRYPWQWYWDSCFAAIVWRRFDPQRSRVELESLLRAQREDGFIAHTIFWDRPLTLPRLAFYNVASRDAFSTATIQPPLLAWAWRIAVGDPAAEPRIVRQAEWLAANRDLEGDGLLWILQPDESGLDASPKFDPVWAWRANSRIGFPLLVRRNRRLGFDARRVLDAGGPVVCEVVTNTLWGLAQIALGRPSITAALVERLWDEQRGLFLDQVLPGGQHPAVATWASLAPLALPDLPETIGRRLVEEHLLDPRRYRSTVGIPSVAMEEPSFEAGFSRWRCWRGPALRRQPPRRRPRGAGRPMAAPARRAARPARRRAHAAAAAADPVGVRDGPRPGRGRAHLHRVERARRAADRAGLEPRRRRRHGGRRDRRGDGRGRRHQRHLGRRRVALRNPHNPQPLSRGSGWGGV
jgi:hypothetical protein